MRFKTIIPLVSLLAALLPPAQLFAGPPPSIRVLVMDSAPSVTIEGKGSALKIASDTARSEERLGALVRIVAGEKGLITGGRDRGNSISLTCSASRYRIGHRSFRGEIAVFWKEPGKLFVVNRVMLEDYLAGLINSEISSSWPKESIKAQAVAARTYAMNQMEASRRASSQRPYDITGTTLDQVYDGAHQEDFRSHDAVKETRGQMLLRGGAIFPAYYHSCCGGRTERAANVWAGEAGPPVIDDKWCARSPKLLWSWRVPIRGFLTALSAAGTNVRVLQTIASTVLPDSPRNELVLLEDDDGMKTVRATELRRIFGYKNIKSTWFETEIKGSDVVFTGRGYGHGVGLCQWGAKAMAEAGHSYDEILKFYYPDSEIATLY